MDQGLGASGVGSGELESLFGNELRQGEKLLWTGRPSPRQLISRADATKLAIGLLLAAAAAQLNLRGMGFFLALFFIAGSIQVSGLGGVWKRAMDAYRLRYAITDQRVIFADTLVGPSITSVPIEQIPGLSKRVDAEGFGLIALRELEFYDLATLDRRGGSSEILGVSCLRDIPHADEVYSLLSGLIGAPEPERQRDTVPFAQTSEPEPTPAPAPASEINLPSAAAPPRAVGPILAAMVTLGSPLMQFGMLWLGFVMVFVRLLLLGLDLVPIASVFSGVGSAPAVVISQRSAGNVTSQNVRRSIAIYRYTFRDQDGRSVESSFCTDSGMYAKGAKITVEYAKANPRISRIAGLEAGASWGIAVFIAAFVAAGIAMVVWALVTSARALKLLRYGQAAAAEYKSAALRRSRNSDSHGYSYSYDICYEFATPSGPQRVLIRQPIEHYRGSQPPVDLDPSVHAQQSIIALYDPANPSGAMALPSIPGDPRLDRQGCAYSGKPWKLINNLLLPAFMLAAHWVWSYMASHGWEPLWARLQDLLSGGL